MTVKKSETNGGIGTSDSRSQAISDLEERDDNEVFTRFLDLPPELRNRVYEYYNAPFSKGLVVPTQPPLARTCRIIRAEVLPVFYATHVFELTLVRTDKKSMGCVTFQEDNDTRNFMTRLPAGSVETVKHPKLVLQNQLPDMKSIARGMVTCSIPLDNSEPGYSADVRPSAGSLMASVLSQRLRASVRRELNRLLETLPKSQGKRQFSIENIHMLRPAVEKGYG